MAGYIGNKAVGLNVTTGNILGDVGVGGDVTVGDDLTVTDDAAIGGTLGVTGLLTALANITIDLGALSGNPRLTFDHDNFAAANYIEVDRASDAMEFQVNGAERFTIETNGNVTIEDGNLVVAAGHGIDFSAQTRSSVTGVANHAELLDHYEEGTWTPTFAGAGGSAGDAAVTDFGSTYTRVGNLVTVLAHFRITNIGSYSGNITFGGLPFASLNTNGGRALGSYAPLKKVELVDTLPYVPSVIKNTIVIAMNRLSGSDQSAKANAQVSAWNDTANENVISITYNTA